MFPSLSCAAKIRGRQLAVRSPGQAAASTIIAKGSSTPIRQDKQMPNTGSAPLDTVTEPAIAGEG
jgi:hypothetical protein